MNPVTPLLSAGLAMSLDDPFWLVLSVVGFTVLVAVPMLLLSGGAYWLLSLPARRQEKASLLLHLIENCLRQGRPLEASIVEIANTGDRSPGLHFHFLAAHIEEGDRFSEALRKVPRLLPPGVAALLRAGGELGDLHAVLPVCRMQLRDTRSSLSGALNYFLVFVFGLAPFAVLLFNLLLIFVLPKFKEIFEGMLEGASSPWIGLLQTVLFWGWVLEAGLFLGLVVALIFYAGGPTLTASLRGPRFPLLDWLALRVPWKRKRLQRNFAATLAILLDHQVPEAAALRLAADCTANEIFRRRAAQAIADLERGLPLAQAVQALDAAGEFRWRLTNAAHGHGDFVRALRGWLESLDARAFQQEQAAAHILSTSLVVFNGVIVGCACAGVFGLLSQIINLGVLW